MTVLDDLVKAESADTEEGFIALVTVALQAFSMTHLQLAKLINVAQSTVTRWVNGTNLPHPLMRRAILDCVKQEAKRRMDLRTHNVRGGEDHAAG